MFEEKSPDNLIISMRVNMIPKLLKPIRSQRGASLVEYALLCALISFLSFAAVKGLGGKLFENFFEMSEIVESMDPGCDGGEKLWCAH